MSPDEFCVEFIEIKKWSVSCVQRVMETSFLIEIGNRERSTNGVQLYPDAIYGPAQHLISAGRIRIGYPLRPR